MWTDTRLNFSNLLKGDFMSNDLDEIYLDLIWKPDVIYANSAEIDGSGTFEGKQKLYLKVGKAPKIEVINAFECEYFLFLSISRQNIHSKNGCVILPELYEVYKVCQK